MALPEIEVDFSRRDESGRVLLDKADLSFYSGSPVGWKGFFCDGVCGAVGFIEEGPVARLWHPPFVIVPDAPERVCQYIDLQNRLDEHRAKPGRPEEDPDEDAILDEMDGVWYAMTPDEIGMVEGYAQNRHREDDD